jgi:hypothetical protein
MEEQAQSGIAEVLSLDHLTESGQPQEKPFDRAFMSSELNGVCSRILIVNRISSDADTQEGFQWWKTRVSSTSRSCIASSQGSRRQEVRGG